MSAPTSASPAYRSSIPSPLETHLQHLSSAQIASLPYPPDVFPGARDVKTSFGDMRVYEWGSEQGRKIMLVHGDATPAPLWKWVAEDLVEKGNRVIVFDLWGRGYSSTPKLGHNGRLYGLQLLFAASSSPLHWSTFSIVGFSLGGTITMEFAAAFPHLVRSVALLAPAGLLRTLPSVYEDLQRAARDPSREAELKGLLMPVLGVEEATETAREEVQSKHEDKEIPIDAAAIVRWQYYRHQGHCYSFTSTLKCGLPTGQHEIWQEACQVLKAKSRPRDGKERLVVMCGSQDWVVPAEHMQEDLDGMMGRDRYTFELIDGGHGLLIDRKASARVVDILEREWNLGGHAV